MESEKKIYLDYAASTPLDSRVWDKMLPYYTQYFGNSSGLHSFALKMQNALDDARQVFADSCGARFSEIVFTSSATEANNLAIKGVALANQHKGRHIILSAVEHASVHNSAQYLNKNGFEISYIKVDEQGNVQLDSLSELIRPDTILVSVLQVNNELGTIQPLAEIGNLCRKNDIYFHTDAAQGFGRYDLQVNANHIDLFSASSQKIYGPLGAGLLFVRNGIPLEPQMDGGGHEDGKRSSTVNIPAIVGFVEAYKIYLSERDQELDRLKNLKTGFIKQLESNISGSWINGDAENGSPHILNVSIDRCDSEILAIQLDRAGIAISTGSACSSGSIKISRVLQACRLSNKRLKSAIRFSFGRHTTQPELERTVAKLVDIVKKVRRIS